MNGEDYAAQVRKLCEDYAGEMERLARERNPLQGFLGFGMTLGQEPCNKQFSRDMEALLQAMAADGTVTSGQVRRALEELFRAASEHPEPNAAYWMLRAVHGLSLPLIGRLDPEDARQMRAAYEADWPRRERVPVQTQLLSALKKAEKEK